MASSIQLNVCGSIIPETKKETDYLTVNNNPDK